MGGSPDTACRVSSGWAGVVEFECGAVSVDELLDHHEGSTDEAGNDVGDARQPTLPAVEGCGLEVLEFGGVVRLSDEFEERRDRHLLGGDVDAQQAIHLGRNGSEGVFDITGQRVGLSAVFVGSKGMT
jgi:hypothetical protein